MYQKEVYEKVPTFILIIIITFGIICVISILLLQPYNEEANEDAVLSEVIVEQSTNESASSRNLIKKHLCSKNPILYAGIALSSYCKNTNIF